MRTGPRSCVTLAIGTALAVLAGCTAPADQSADPGPPGPPAGPKLDAAAGPTPAAPPDAAPATPPTPDAAATPPPAGDDAAPPAPDVAGEAAAQPPPTAGGPLPAVDRNATRPPSLMFKASDADPQASKLLGNQQAFLHNKVAPLGTLVVHLHGSGEKVTCGYADHGQLLASWGFHVFMPCYDAAVSWSNDSCGGAVGDCRLEMLDGMDHSPRLAIAPPQAIEVRMVRALAHLARTDPGGDWGFFLEGDRPRWPRIIISGQSFGATSSMLIAKHRPVLRAVALSGPLDGGAAWLKAPSMTPLDRLFAFTHVNDGQHPTHKNSLAALGLPGAFVEVEKSAPPYMDSHRLVGGQTMFAGARVDGHNATEARMQSPRDPATGAWLYAPVWRYLYGLPPE